MPPATSPPALATASPSDNLEQITHLLNRLLPSAHSVNCFSSRWQVLRAKLASLKSLVFEISGSPHWPENLLLPPILVSLISTLLRVETLSLQCSDAGSFNRGKLLVQSDLDMASGWVSKHVNELELLLGCGVLRQSAAIVPPRPNPNSSPDELAFFVKDLFARLQIGGLDFKRKALDSLIQLLSEDDKSATVVAKEGNVNCLISLLDMNCHDSIRQLAVHAISLLVSSGDFHRKCVFEEGALGPLLRTIDGSSMPMKEKAAMAVEFITSDPDHAWAISAYGGVPILIELCKSGSLEAQSHAIGAIRNISAVEDIQIALVEEGAIPVLMQLLVSGNALAQRKACSCLSILASSESGNPNAIQEVGAKALISMLLVKSNRKEFVRDEKCLMKLVPLLDPNNDMTSKKFPVAVVAALMAGGSQGCRKKLVAAGVSGHLEKLVEMNVTGAKKTLQRFSRNRLSSILLRALRE